LSPKDSSSKRKPIAVCRSIECCEVLDSPNSQFARKVDRWRAVGRWSSLEGWDLFRGSVNLGFLHRSSHQHGTVSRYHGGRKYSFPRRIRTRVWLLPLRVKLHSEKDDWCYSKAMGRGMGRCYVQLDDKFHRWQSRGTRDEKAVIVRLLGEEQVGGSTSTLRWTGNNMMGMLRGVTLRLYKQ
jgi:hypothetical protein